MFEAKEYKFLTPVFTLGSRDYGRVVVLSVSGRPAMVMYYIDIAIFVKMYIALWSRRGTCDAHVTLDNFILLK